MGREIESYGYVFIYKLRIMYISWPGITNGEHLLFYNYNYFIRHNDTYAD